MHKTFNSFFKSLLLNFLLVLPALGQQEGTVKAFRLEENPIALHRLAQPQTYFDKVGRKFALLGYESGTFEVWAYPLKLFRNFELSFLIGSSTEPIHAKNIVRYITATPEATVLTYTYQSFAVKAIFITPVNEPGSIILLDVTTTEPLTIVCSFLPALQPMWPAGLGGQYAYWDNEMKAYVISESSGKNHAYLGSPAAEGISYTPAHMLSDVPNQFKINIKDPKALLGWYIPILMVGGKGKRNDVKAVYQKLAANPEEWYRKNVTHYKELRESTMQVETPNKQVNLAFEWAKVAYDNLQVDNPDLGLGLVAGLGASGTSGRPGFGWFFGGDAYINSFSIVSYGAFSTVRDALAFTQKFQREDGKMPHEITQATAYVDWFKDYRYAYIHGDTSPFYVAAMYDYYRMTGDAKFVKESWKSIQRAYEWSLATDEDGDGLMDNKKAGLGATEYGPLTGVQSDIYAAAVWVRASYVIRFLAEAAGEREFASKSIAVYEKASTAFNEKFWDDAGQHYSFAFNAQGEHVHEVTPWPSVGLMWNLGEKERSYRSMEKLNSSELTTDWGMRSISIKSKYFEPLNYNYGAVWPFITSWVATAQYKHNLALQGYNSLMSSVRHTFDNALGYVTEVFSGYQNSWPQEAVSHQGFCTAGVVLPFVRGMLGLEGDATTNELVLAPHFPANWGSVTVRNYHIGSEFFDLHYTRNTTTLTLELRSKGQQPYKVKYRPAFGIGTKIVSVNVDGKPVKAEEVESPQSIQAEVEFVMKGNSARVEIEFEPTVELLPPDIQPNVGDINKGLKILSTRWSKKQLNITLEGIAGESYILPLTLPEKIESVVGASVQGNALKVEIPLEGAVGEFLKKEVSIKIK